MINYDATEKIEVADVLRRASAPLTLSTSNATPQQPQATPAPARGPITPIPLTPLDTLIKHDQIKREFRLDILSLYISIVLVAAIFTTVWLYLFH